MSHPLISYWKASVIAKHNVDEGGEVYLDHTREEKGMNITPLNLFLKISFFSCFTVLFNCSNLYLYLIACMWVCMWTLEI